MKKIIPIVVIALALTAVIGYLMVFREGAPWADKIGGIGSLLPDGGIESIRVHMNQDTDSNLAMTALSERGEGVAVFVEQEGGLEYVSLMVLMDSENNIGKVEVSREGLPASFEYRNHRITYGNYTDTTVDLTVVTPEGMTESYPGTPLNLPDEDGGLSLIPAASAAVQGVQPAPSDARATEDGFRYYPHSAGQLINFTLCSIGAVVATVGSGGWGAPLLVSCGTLITRGVTSVTGYGDCAGDIIDCSTGALIDELQKHGPGFMKDGFRIKGSVHNSMNDQVIHGGIIKTEIRGGGAGPRGEWYRDGSYDIYFAEPGDYTATFVTEGYADIEVDVVVEENQASVFQVGAMKGVLIEYPEKWSGQAYGEHAMALALMPDAWIRGEVIDAESGMPIKGVQMALVANDGNEWAVDETDAEGMFSMQPRLVGPDPQGVKITASAEGYRTAVSAHGLDYSVRQESDEYELEGWDGILRMEKGLEVWQITGSEKPGGLTCMWAVNSFDMVIKDGQAEYRTFGGDCADAQGCPSSLKLIGTVSAPGHIDLDVAFDETSVFSSFEGNLSSESGSGTWYKPIPEGVSKGELHHYQSCSGTWTAKKVIK